MGSLRENPSEDAEVIKEEHLNSDSTKTRIAAKRRAYRPEWEELEWARGWLCQGEEEGEAYCR